MPRGVLVQVQSGAPSTDSGRTPLLAKTPILLEHQNFFPIQAAFIGASSIKVKSDASYITDTQGRTGLSLGWLSLVDMNETLKWRLGLSYKQRKYKLRTTNDDIEKGSAYLEVLVTALYDFSRIAKGHFRTSKNFGLELDFSHGITPLVSADGDDLMFNELTVRLLYYFQ